MHKSKVILKSNEKKIYWSINDESDIDYYLMKRIYLCNTMNKNKPYIKKINIKINISSS